MTYTVEMAFAALAAHGQGRVANPSRLREIDRELAKLVRLAAATGDIPEVASAITGLKAEAAALRLAARSGRPVTKALRRQIMLCSSARRSTPGPTRPGPHCGPFLGERRMRVAADQQHGWRVVGLFECPNWKGPGAWPGPRW